MTAGTSGSGHSNRPKTIDVEISPAHYLQLILHRKWIVITIFLSVSIVTAVIAQRLPNIYTSETVILVDPQKVPESYVKATVTGDVRNRLGTLSQQILSASRLQKIIESLNLYQQERKEMVREDVQAQMRRDINVSLVTAGGAQNDLQAFKISYSNRDPRLAARVAGEWPDHFTTRPPRTPFIMSTASVAVSELLISSSVKPSLCSSVRSAPLNFILQMPASILETVSIF